MTKPQGGCIKQYKGKGVFEYSDSKALFLYFKEEPVQIKKVKGRDVFWCLHERCLFFLEKEK